MIHKVTLNDWKPLEIMKDSGYGGLGNTWMREYVRGLAAEFWIYRNF